MKMQALIIKLKVCEVHYNTFIDHLTTVIQNPDLLLSNAWQLFDFENLLL